MLHRRHLRVTAGRMRGSVHDGVNGHDLHGPEKQENTSKYFKS